MGLFGWVSRRRPLVVWSSSIRCRSARSSCGRRAGPAALPMVVGVLYLAHGGESGCWHHPVPARTDQVQRDPVWTARASRVARAHMPAGTRVWQRPVKPSVARRQVRRPASFASPDLSRSPTSLGTGRRCLLFGFPAPCTPDLPPGLASRRSPATLSPRLWVAGDPHSRPPCGTRPETAAALSSSPCA